MVALGFAAFDMGRDFIVLRGRDELERAGRILIVEIYGCGRRAILDVQIYAVGLLAFQVAEKHVLGHCGLDLAHLPRGGIVCAIDVCQAAEEPLKERDLFICASWFF